MVGNILMSDRVDQINQVACVQLNYIKADPYFGFLLDREGALRIYEIIYAKGYKCLSQYLGSKTAMSVRCPYGHDWHGYPKKVTIPCNNCQECWNNRRLTPAEKLSEIIISKRGTQLTPYVKNNLKIRIRCFYLHEFDVTPGCVTGGNWCNICAGNNVEEAKARFYAILTANGARPVGPYINSTTKVEIICKYGHTYLQVPSSTNMGHGCPFCSGNTTVQGEAHLLEAIAAKGGKLLTPYVNRYTKVDILCAFEHIFSVVPGSVTKGGWCIKCANKCPIQARERFIATVRAQGGIVLGEYVTVHVKVSIQCMWEHVFDMTPGHISGGEWCPICRGHCPIQAKVKFEAIVAKRKGIIVGEYVNTFTKVAVRCEFGHLFEIKPNNATNNRWCRLCGLCESHGERCVREFLTEKRIEHKPEATFNWFPMKRYDFYFTYNNRHYLVEFDGIQHFIYTPFFCPNEEDFVRRQQTDAEKTVRALNNGYFLIRIAHSDINDIAEIIDGCINDQAPLGRLTLSDTPMYQWLLNAVVPRLL